LKPDREEGNEEVYKKRRMPHKLRSAGTMDIFGSPKQARKFTL
jgi:hypothetical protein